MTVTRPVKLPMAPWLPQERNAGPVRPLLCCLLSVTGVHPSMSVRGKSFLCLPRVTQLVPEHIQLWAGEHVQTLVGAELGQHCRRGHGPWCHQGPPWIHNTFISL